MRALAAVALVLTFAAGVSSGPILTGAPAHQIRQGARRQEGALPRQPLRLRGGEGGLSPELTARLEGLIKSAPVMLFMKGTPEQPQCGFSSKIIAILQQQGLEFSTFNILEDQEVRQGLKELSDWPTYPQLYGSGKLVGGLDVVRELAEAGELEKELGVGTPAKATEAGLRDKITAALKAERVDVVDESDGCGAKFSVFVVAEAFEGMSVLERQRAVHDAIKAEMKTMHALTLKCKTPEQAKAMAA